MMKTNKILYYLNKVATGFEFVIAVILLIIIAIKVIEMISGLIGSDITIITEDFDSILSMAFILVIGLEFTKMLCKYTPETVIDVLLFAMARQTILYHKSTVDMLVGVVAITGLFAARKFLVDARQEKNKKSETEVT